MGRSSFLLGFGNRFVILDAGGPSNRKQRPTDFAKTLEEIGQVEIVAVIISHAHADHLGGLPSLVKALDATGRSLPIYTTPETKELSKPILIDSLHRKRAYRTKLEYEEQFVEEIYRRTVAVDYDKDYPIADGLLLTFVKNNHIPGAAMSLLNWEGRKLLYTGDIKFGPTFLNKRINISKLANRFRNVDALICESTYAGKPMETAMSPDQLREAVGKRVSKTISGKGAVLIPAFGLGRTQEVLKMFEEIEVENQALKKVPKYINGMGVTLTDTLGVTLPQGWKKIDFRYERHLDDPAEIPFMRVMNRERPCIIVSTPGMPTNGGAGNLLAKVLEEENSAVLVLGYQDDSSPLPHYLDHQKGDVVEYGGVDTIVQCDIEHFNMKGHEVPTMMAQWLAWTEPKHLFVVHGDVNAEAHLIEMVRERIRKGASTTFTACKSGSLYTLNLLDGREPNLVEDFVPWDPPGRVSSILVQYAALEPAYNAVLAVASDEPVVYADNKLIHAFIPKSKGSDKEIETAILGAGADLLGTLDEEWLTDHALARRVRNAMSGLVTVLSKNLGPDQIEKLKQVGIPSCRFARLDENIMGLYYPGRLSIHPVVPFFDFPVEGRPLNSSLFAAVVSHELAHVIQNAALGMHYFQTASMEFKEGFAEYVTYIVDGSPVFDWKDFDKLAHMKEFISHVSFKGKTIMQGESLHERASIYKKGFQDFLMIEQYLGREKALEIGLFSPREARKTLDQALERASAEKKALLDELMNELGMNEFEVDEWWDGRKYHFTASTQIKDMERVKSETKPFSVLAQIEELPRDIPPNSIDIDWVDLKKYVGSRRLSVIENRYLEWRSKDEDALARSFIDMAHSNLYVQVVLPRHGICVSFPQKVSKEEMETAQKAKQVKSPADFSSV